MTKTLCTAVVLAALIGAITGPALADESGKKTDAAKKMDPVQLRVDMRKL